MWHDSFICDMKARGDIKYRVGGRILLMYSVRILLNCALSQSNRIWCMTRIWCIKRIWYSLPASIRCASGRTHVSYDSFICDVTHSYVTRLIHMWDDSFRCDMTRSCVTWLILMWHDSFICDMTRSYMTWLIHIWHESARGYQVSSCVGARRDALMCPMSHVNVTWSVCDMTPSYITWLVQTWRDVFVCARTNVCVAWLIHTSHDQSVTWLVHT